MSDVQITAHRGKNINLRKKRPRQPSSDLEHTRAFSSSHDTSNSQTRPVQTHIPSFEQCRENPMSFLDWLVIGAMSKQNVQLKGKQFLDSYFQKRVLFVDRHATDPTFFQNKVDFLTSPLASPVFVDWSTDKMIEIVGSKQLRFGVDINVVRYDKALKKRVTYANDGVLSRNELEKLMQEGWSVRFLRPHEHSPFVSMIVNLLEEATCSSGGANTYWTPGGTQGFAPHYDDVDVFLLQLEGTKRWKLYAPQDEHDVLSRHSSEDYTPEQLGKPTFVTELRAGDMLYMPRGRIHQGDTHDYNTHSLHITISVNQMHSWADMMHSILRQRIDTMAANNVKWRTSPPIEWMNALGSINGKDFAMNYLEGQQLVTTNTEMRPKLLKHVREMLTELFEDCTTAMSIDSGVDIYAKELLEKRQPPPVLEPAASCPSEVSLDSKIVMRCPTGARLEVRKASQEIILHHTASNSVICYGASQGVLRFQDCFAATLANVLCSYPEHISVSSLPVPDVETESGVLDEKEMNDNRLLVARALVTSKVCEIIN
eukprot:Tbor_TRINITY_DN3846_c0_g1::TRINITY_DN3846_c0_g1_i1::g.5679::m.5679/K16914/RIOX1, NO66; bifunctional lysine-specific demethylase and histidyl-hydroxylase NO66